MGDVVRLISASAEATVFFPMCQQLFYLLVHEGQILLPGKAGKESIFKSEGRVIMGQHLLFAGPGLVRG